jgi:type IV secretory pathway protease TraF
MFGFFRERLTVDGIMAGFSRVLDDLGTVINERQDEVAALNSQIVDLTERADRSLDEIYRARHIVKQISAITTPPSAETAAKLDDEIPF